MLAGGKHRLEHQGRCWGQEEDGVGWLISALTWGGRPPPCPALGVALPRLERASVAANVFRSVLGLGPELGHSTSELQRIRAWTEGGGGGAGSALQRGSQGGWPGRALGCGPGRPERTVQMMGGRQGGTVGIRDTEHSHRKGTDSLAN